MVKSEKGFTLIELLVALIFLGIGGFVLVGIVFGFGGGNFLPSQRQATAQQNLAVSLEQLGVQYKGAVCSGDDSDANSYVTCTVNLENDQTSIYECPYSGFAWANKSCKANPFTQFQTPSL